MRKQKLKEHQRIHIDERPFSCRFCDKHFRQKRSLDYHEKAHTNEGSTQIHLNDVEGGSNSVAEGKNIIFIVCFLWFLTDSLINSAYNKYYKQQVIDIFTVRLLGLLYFNL